jgi:hypothetical protein
MSVGEDVLLDVRFCSAQARPANLNHGGRLGSAPEGAYHDTLAGQIRVGRCASLCLKASSTTCSPMTREQSFITPFTTQACHKQRSSSFHVTSNLLTVSDETSILA